MNCYKQGLQADEIYLNGGMALVLQIEELLSGAVSNTQPVICGEFEAENGINSFTLTAK